MADRRDGQPPSPANPETRTWLASGAEQQPGQPASEEHTHNLKVRIEPQAPSHTPQHPASIGDAVKTIKLGDFTEVYKKPCSREGFMTGMGAGAVMGMLRFILGAPIPRAANWAVGAGIIGALGQYEYCQYQRGKEREFMKRVVEVYDKKQAEARQKEEEKKREKLAAEEEAARLKAQRSWYKFW